MYDRGLVQDILQQVGVVYSVCADYIGVLEQTIQMMLADVAAESL